MHSQHGSEIESTYGYKKSISTLYANYILICKQVFRVKIEECRDLSKSTQLGKFCSPCTKECLRFPNTVVPPLTDTCHKRTPKLPSRKFLY